MQTDLVLEAKHLNDFNVNFGGKAWSDCVFPRVIHCVEDVLVSEGFICLPNAVALLIVVRANFSAFFFFFFQTSRCQVVL